MLFDMLYLAPARSRLFARLPELEIAGDFNWRQLHELCALVKLARRRVHIERRNEEIERESSTGSALARRRTRRPQRRRD